MREAWQSGVKAALASFLETHPRPAIGDAFEYGGQRWEVVGFDRRHLVNQPPRVLSAVLETHCAKCGTKVHTSLRAMRSPSPMCREHRSSPPPGAQARFKVGRGSIISDGLPARLRAHLASLAPVTDRMELGAFVRSALPLVERRGKRDLRAQRIKQAIRRMARLDQLPEGVTLTPSGFRFD